MSAATQMAILSNLPHDLLVVIAKRLKKKEDFVCFRCVSKSSFAAIKDEYFEGVRLRQRTPYLLLPVRDDGDDDIRELYSLVDGESIVASVKAPNLKTKKCFESLGWLLVVGEDGNMSLLDPFSGTEIPLPHQSTFPGCEGVRMSAHVFIHKMVLSSRPNEASDFVLMVIFGRLGHLGFWRLGDKAWNKINKCKQQFTDVVYHGYGKFYAIGYPVSVSFIKFARNDKNPICGLIMYCETMVPKLESMDPPPVEHPMDYYSNGTKNLYIIRTVDKRLLIIIRIIPNLSEDGSSYITSKFLVFEVDTKTRSWKEIYSLGSMAVFLGHNSTISVDASRFPRGGVIKPNRIYFTEDEWEYYYFQSPKGGGMDMGIYNLETGTIEPVHPGEPLQSKVSTPLWINPCI